MYFVLLLIGAFFEFFCVFSIYRLLILFSLNAVC